MFFFFSQRPQLRQTRQTTCGVGDKVITLTGESSSDPAAECIADPKVILTVNCSQQRWYRH